MGRSRQVFTIMMKADAKKKIIAQHIAEYVDKTNKKINPLCPPTGA